MKTVIIVNPRAGGGKVGRRWNHYNRSISSCFGPAEVRFTQHSGHATQLTFESLRTGFTRLVVVGGDGTLGECVNGLFDADGGFLGEGVCLVLYPAGTGGDFCRSIGLAQQDNLESALLGASQRAVDLGRVRLLGNNGRPLTRYFLNISSFGASGLVVDRVNNSSKVLGGKVSFLLGTLQGLLAYRNQPVRLQIDDIFDEEVAANTVAVANGRFFGGSMKVAPDALLNDGLLDIVIIEDIGLLDFIRYSRRLYRGTHLNLKGIRMVRGAHVVATPLRDATLLVDVDGEQLGRLPAEYDILPQKLQVYAPWERAEALAVT